MRSVDVAERLMDRSTPVPITGCLLWLGSTTRLGYGMMSVHSVNRTVHRLAYELAKGPIPEGMVLDHLCRVRCCINPDHLEAVTQKENVMRGDCPTAINARKTHCKRGHALDEVNTYYYPRSRACRQCIKEQGRNYRATHARKSRAKNNVDINPSSP